MCYCTDHLIFQDQHHEANHYENIIFERIQIQGVKFLEADVFHCRRWSGSRETTQHTNYRKYTYQR